MYTRSRSSNGGPGFGNGRGPMNPGNGNPFQGPHPYSHQGGNYQQSNFKPGMIQPEAPFKPSGPPMSMQGRLNNQQQQQPQQQSQNLQQNQNQPQQSPKLKPILKQTVASPATSTALPSSSTPSPVPPPTTTNLPAPATPVSNASANSAPSTPAVNPVASSAPTTPAPSTPAPAAPLATPTTQPAAAAVAPPAKVDATSTKSVSAADESAINKTAETTEKTAQPEEPMDGDDPRRWMEDDQGRWMETEDQSGQWLDTEDGQAPAKGRREEWRRVKKLTAKKPNKVLKRLRMNRRLRKTLMPKNAIMVLNEMKAGVNFTFPETQAIMPNSLFLVHAELEGKIYVGQGLSKPLARQNAAENALKCLLLEKMTAAAMKERVETYGDNTAMDVSENQPTTEANSEENNEETVEENDDIPWSSLASFALYKLFLEWQNQGTVVPIPRPGGPQLPKNRTEPRTLTDKVLPTNALDIHPVMLLNQMRPGTTYNEVGRVGNPPNILFTLGVEINGTTYTGTAKNKKDAKKIAAKEALSALFNLVYPEEQPKADVVEMPQ